MKLPRPPQSFESRAELDDYLDDRDDAYDAECQAADDAWKDRE